MEPASVESKSERRSNAPAVRWQSRDDLINYFQKMYDIPREEVMEEIEFSIKTFRLRKGLPIDTRELWQKVGMNLERRLCETDGSTDEFLI